MRRLTFLFLLVCAPLSAGVWGERGISHAFLVRDNLVYDVDGRGVALYDATTFKRVAVVDTASESLDGAFLGNDLLVLTRTTIDRYDRNFVRLAQLPASGFEHLRANGTYVAAASANAATVWASDLAELQRLTFTRNVAAIALKGDALYVAHGEGGIEIVDLTNGNRGVLAENAQDLAVDGNNLYVAGGVNGLLVADVADPFAPRVVRREGAGAMNLAHVAASGAKIAASEPPSTIRLFDDSGQTNVITEPVQTLTVSGTRLYVSGTTFDSFGLRTETGLPLRVYDVAGAPRLVGQVQDLAGPVSGVATDGTLAYVVDRPFFRVLDVSTTSAPRELAALSIDAIQDHVKLLGKQVILYGRGDVDLIDVSDPYHPRLVKVFHSFGHPPSNAAFARTTIVEGNAFSGFHVVDFTSFSDPLQIGGLKGHYDEVVANGGDVAYIAGQGASIAAIDLRDTHNPVATKVIPVNVKQAYISGSQLVVRSIDGIHVYSLGDPLQPVETAFVPMTEPGVIGPAADGNAALVWIGDALVRVDLAARMVAASGLDALSPMQIDSAAGKTVVADRYSVRVFGPDTAPPPPPGPPARRRAARP